MTERESILSRIKKLQSLTVDRGATPEEAATAAAKAQALLFEHNLQQAEVDTALGADHKPDPYGQIHHEHKNATRTTILWRRSLLHIIAESNFCTTCSTPGTTKQYVIGKKSNVETVLYLNEVIAGQIERMADEAARSQLTDKAAFRNSFAYGCVSTIHQRLRAQRQADEHKATAYDVGDYTHNAQCDKNALVLRNSAVALQDAFKKFHPKVKSGTGGTIRSGSGYAAGQKAGHNISMNRGIHTSGHRRALS